MFNNSVLACFVMLETNARVLSKRIFRAWCCEMVDVQTSEVNKLKQTGKIAKMLRTHG